MIFHRNSLLAAVLAVRIRELSAGARAEFRRVIAWR